MDFSIVLADFLANFSHLSGFHPEQIVFVPTAIDKLRLERANSNADSDQLRQAHYFSQEQVFLIENCRCCKFCFEAR